LILGDSGTKVLVIRVVTILVPVLASERLKLPPLAVFQIPLFLQILH